MHELQPEFELSQEMANRIVGSVFWDQINSFVRQTRRNLNVQVMHIAGDRAAKYMTQLSTADDGEPETDGEAQLRANEITDADGSRTTQFRIKCRFANGLTDSGLVGFEQTGRLVDGFAVVDSVVELFDVDV